ncbi:MAG: hypothetical protein SF028_07805 [Candidatus Sumerlaeia bacterium]|nr:hypothetical protein [Candidatus Sumerlaeia bacterium]
MLTTERYANRVAVAYLVVGSALFFGAMFHVWRGAAYRAYELSPEGVPEQSVRAPQRAPAAPMEPTRYVPPASPAVIVY